MERMDENTGMVQNRTYLKYDEDVLNKNQTKIKHKRVYKNDRGKQKGLSM